MPSWATVKRDRWAWGVVWTSQAIHGEARGLTFGAQCLLGCLVLPRRLYQRASLGAPAAVRITCWSTSNFRRLGWELPPEAGPLGS